jgi:peptide chain release factor 2
MMDFFKEGDVTEEEVETLYQSTLSHIEDLETCFPMKEIA